MPTTTKKWSLDNIRRISVGDQVPGVIALTALHPLDDGTALLGTTTTGSGGPVLLRFDPADGRVEDTGFRFPAKGAPGSAGHGVGDKIHHAIAPGAGRFAGRVLLGHGSHIWWDDGGWPFDPAHFAGGAVYAFDPSSGAVETVGVPVASNTVHGLYTGRGFTVGYSLPDNHFFSIDLDAATTIDFGRISAYCCHGFGCAGGRAFGVYRRSVGEQRGDVVVSSTNAAFLFYYDHDGRALTRTDIRVSDLDVNIRFNSGVDSWLDSPGGLIGGRVDGSLFRLLPESLTIEELGGAIDPTRPDLSPEDVRRLGGTACRGISGAERVTSLALLDDRRVLGTAGFPRMHLFVLDLHTDTTMDLGPINDTSEMCYFHDLAVVARPTGERFAVLAETDSGRPDLYVLAIPD